MHEKEIIELIRKNNSNIGQLKDKVLQDMVFREKVVSLQLEHPDIMVYYQCYSILSQASEEQPAIFYRYWDNFAALLLHPNSYHRDIGLTIIANLTGTDRENRFEKLFNNYFILLNDKKFMTGLCCVRNSIKIIRFKPELKSRVVDLLLDFRNICTYSEKQMDLYQSDVLDVLDSVYESHPNKIEIAAFVFKALGCGSPKTQKRAKTFIRKHNITEIL